MPLQETVLNNLRRTTIIDLNDTAKAESQFNQLDGSNKIVMVILGDSPSINPGVELADRKAWQMETNETLWVMYVGNHTTLKAQLEPFLTAANALDADTPYEEIKAFCLSRAPRKAQTRVHMQGRLTAFKVENMFDEAILNSPEDSAS